jgi:hypothetical protein
MKDPSATRRLEPPTLEQFKQFVSKIIAVPKGEIDREEKAYRKKRLIKKIKQPSS